jgi:hypothetical protein
MSEKFYLPHYVGEIHPNCDYHHGQIFPAKGVKCYQVSRANRGNKGLDDNTGYTYKHAPDIAYFNNKFYVQYLCNPEDEHAGAGMSILATSKEGCIWEEFQISFPTYQIKSTTITDYKGLTHNFDGSSYAYMHQRMSFYHSSTYRMLILGFYGWSPEKWMTNWDNYGIGRVVRELYKDGTLGPIYFIRVNQQAGWRLEDLNYPLYTESTDDGFVFACEELLRNKLYVQQWAEENGDIDHLIHIKHPKNGETNQAFCWYHIDEKTVIGLWKHAKVSRSDDGGETWRPIIKSPSLVMSGQKVWACKTSDDKYAMVYDPTLETQHRYPLCVTTSEDGITFDHMLLVHGEVPPIRYKGFWKDLGPQYVRGLTEGLELPDKNLWVTYSVNKEDIWVAKIPVPIIEIENSDDCITDYFNKSEVLNNWNFYCPKWTKVEMLCDTRVSYLHVVDNEPYDYSRIERLFNKNKYKIINFKIKLNEIKTDGLYIEVCNDIGQIAVRLVFKNGYLYARTVTELNVINYDLNYLYNIDLYIDCECLSYFIKINNSLITDDNGKPKDWPFMMAVNSVSRFVMRTGKVRNQFMLDINPDNLTEKPLLNSEKPITKISYDLYSFAARVWE